MFPRILFPNFFGNLFSLFKHITTPAFASIISSAINLKFGKYMTQLFFYLIIATSHNIWDNVFKNGPSKSCGRQFEFIWSAKAIKPTCSFLTLPLKISEKTLLF